MKVPPLLPLMKMNTIDVMRKVDLGGIEVGGTKAEGDKEMTLTPWIQHRIQTFPGDLITTAVSDNSFVLFSF